MKLIRRAVFVAALAKGGCARRLAEAMGAGSYLVSTAAIECMVRGG
jgi:hypothetical protein